MKYLFPFMAVVLGYGVGYLMRTDNKRNIKLLLAFSGAFLLSLTVMHLLPEIYHHATAHANLTSEALAHDSSAHAHGHAHDHDSFKRIGVFIMIGIVFQMVLEFFSKGAEHGHVHGKDKLSHIPWSLFISLCIHAFFEGMPVAQHPDMAWGIAIHHLPIAVILTLFMRSSHLTNASIAFFMVVFAAMTPLGTYVTDYTPWIQNYYTELTAVVVGILFHIASTIIFEASENHKFNLAKVSAIVLGVLLAFFL